MFIRHTCNFFKFLPLVFLQQNLFCTVFIFCKFSLDQYHMCEYNWFISFLPQCLSVTRANFLSSFPLYFYKKNFCTVFILCKFSYSDQFYSFTSQLFYIIFYHNVHRSHVQILYFSSFLFFIEIKSHWWGLQSESKRLII